MVGGQRRHQWRRICGYDKFFASADWAVNREVWQGLFLSMVLRQSKQWNDDDIILGQNIYTKTPFAIHFFTFKHHITGMECISKIEPSIISNLCPHVLPWSCDNIIIPTKANRRDRMIRFNNDSILYLRPVTGYQSFCCPSVLI